MPWKIKPRVKRFWRKIKFWASPQTWWALVCFYPRRIREKWRGSTILEADKDTGEVYRIPGFFDRINVTRKQRIITGFGNLGKK